MIFNKIFQNNFSKKIIIFSFIVLFLSLYFYFKYSEAQVCVPMDGYLVWPGTWESGRIPMASTSQYFLTASPLYSNGLNVGIGITNPVYKLQVNGDISGTRLCIGSDCRSVWPSGGGIAGSGTTNYLSKWTGSTSIGNSIIYDNGINIGIGTISPENSAGWNRVLDVYGSSHSRIIASANNLRTVLTSHTGGFYGAPAGGIIGTETAHPLSFITGSSTRVTIATSGDVGIGTTLPLQKLHVAGGYIRSDTGFCIGTNCITNWPSGGGISGSGTTGQVTFWASATSLGGDTNLFWDNTNKRLGIGTSTPIRQLNIYGSDNPNFIRVHSSGAFGAAGIEFVSDPAGSSNVWRPGYIISGDNGGFTGRLDFYTNGSGSANKWNSILGMSIVNGNVGIGTTNPSSKLEVVGGPIKATDGLIIETRTSDPASPAIGQIWLRTDL
jgi:hypothetical protein